MQIVFCGGVVSLEDVQLRLAQFAQQYGFAPAFHVATVRYPENPNQICVHFSTIGLGRQTEFLEEALKTAGVYEECPECAKRKKWSGTWSSHAQGMPTLTEVMDGARVILRERENASRAKLRSRTAELFGFTSLSRRPPL